jgi:hypothetical protein
MFDLVHLYYIIVPSVLLFGRNRKGSPERHIDASQSFLSQLLNPLGDPIRNLLFRLLYKLSS